MEPEFPRPMTATEREVLDFLLSADYPGVDALRDQAHHALVADTFPEGCPNFILSVDRLRAQRAPFGMVVAADSVSTDELLSLMLFALDGWLVSVELVWYDEMSPSTFPDVRLFAPPRQIDVGSPLSERRRPWWKRLLGSE